MESPIEKQKLRAFVHNEIQSCEECMEMRKLKAEDEPDNPEHEEMLSFYWGRIYSLREIQNRFDL